MNHNSDDIDLVVLPFDADKSAAVVSWVISREEQFRWAGHSLPFPVTADDFRRLVESFPYDHHAYGIYLDQNAELVGYFELNVDIANCSARIGRVIISPSQRGGGIGTKLINAALNICFNEHPLLRVDLLVASENHAAINCYLNAGMEHEGVMRNARFFDGRARDMILMSRIT